MWKWILNWTASHGLLFILTKETDLGQRSSTVHRYFGSEDKRYVMSQHSHRLYLLRDWEWKFGWEYHGQLPVGAWLFVCVCACTFVCVCLTGCHAHISPWAFICEWCVYGHQPWKNRKVEPDLCISKERTDMCRCIFTPGLAEMKTDLNANTNVIIIFNYFDLSLSHLLLVIFFIFLVVLFLVLAHIL